MTSEPTSNALTALAPEASVSPADAEAIYLLLEERIRRYTMGDSTSVPADTARRLLGSILYCLDLNRRFPAQGATQNAPLHVRWRAGADRAKRICGRAKLLLKQAQRTPPPLVNTAYCDTLEALPAFFAGYDAEFFAQEIPCSFDYPLCQPVSESLLGAEYILEYLRKLLAENALLRAFSQDALRALYGRYYVDYADLLVNLCLPAAEMATLSALASQPARNLSLSQAEMARISEALSRESEREARERFCNASDRALAELNLQGEYLFSLLRQTADDLWVRIRAAANG